MTPIEIIEFFKISRWLYNQWKEYKKSIKDAAWDEFLKLLKGLLKEELQKVNKEYLETLQTSSEVVKIQKENIESLKEYIRRLEDIIEDSGGYIQQRLTKRK